MSSTLLRRCRADRVFVFLLSTKEVLNCVLTWKLPTSNPNSFKNPIKVIAFYSALFVSHTGQS